MKKVKLFSVLSFTLIFIGITAGFSKKFENLTSQSSGYPVVTYQVIIHPDFGSKPCNNYFIKVLDETGRLVAPPKYYVPGNNKYSFTERVFTKESLQKRRIAVLEEVLIPVYNACANPLFALPDVKDGPFLVGQTYTFDLYPKTQSQGTD